MYINDQMLAPKPPASASEASGACASSIVGRAGMGDVTSFAQSLGTDPTHLFVIGGLGVVMGWFANSLVSGTQKRIGKARRAARSRARKTSAAIGTAVKAPIPAWVVALGVAAVGVGLYLYMKKPAPVVASK